MLVLKVGDRSTKIKPPSTFLHKKAPKQARSQFQELVNADGLVF
ncbi:unnamed protein product [Musa acuminata subsp. malaccensis]|uniref:(wild Malaysian banana) hypothetical protein n=1 Tax=Musa acuminata subsp. malaccensis TaxID=214687 RepID=A0A804KEG2_MUSAM|nr:unnamed protein product [Musa acuminata subsp. malaccensis]